MKAEDVSKAEGMLKGASLFDKYVRQSPAPEEERKATTGTAEDIPGEAKAQYEPVTTVSYKLVRADARETRTARFQAVFPAGLKELLDRESARSGMSKNEIVIQAVYRFIKEKEEGRG